MDEPMTLTPTGIPVADCHCGYRHPVSRRHCTVCGRAALFCHPEVSRA